MYKQELITTYDLSHAMISLRPNSAWIIREDDYDSIEWLDENESIPSKEELEAERDRLQYEYDIKQYQRDRVSEYPPIADFIDAYYWSLKGNEELMNIYIDKCDQVKLKYPKPL